MARKSGSSGSVSSRPVLEEDARHELIGGPYPIPLVKRGQVIRDEIRGDVVVVGYSKAKHPWPIGGLKGGPSLIIYGRLLDAIRYESNIALCHHWGLDRQAVSELRRALRIRRRTSIAAALQALDESRPELREQRCALFSGPKFQAMLTRLHSLNTGRRHTEQSRQNMRDAHLRWRAEKAAGTFKPNRVLTEAQKAQMKETRRRYEKRRQAERKASGETTRPKGPVKG